MYYYLTTLYCNSYGKLRKCVANDVVLPPLDQKYKGLMNWTIQDEVVIDVDIPYNSTNNDRSNNDLNEEPRLASSWGTQYKFTRSSWGTIPTRLLIQVGEEIVYQMKEVLVALVLLTYYQP